MMQVSSADREDALREAINIGMGAAGAALAEALGTFVRLSVPEVKEVPPGAVVDLLAARWAERQVNASYQAFYGEVSGEALAIFDDTAGRSVADLLGHDVNDQSSDEGRSADEILLELGNLMTGACVNGIVDRFNEPIHLAPPVLVCQAGDLRATLHPTPTTASRALVVCIDFAIDERQFATRVGIVISEASFATLDEAIDRFFADLLAS